MEGVDLITVKELGGWKSLAMVQRHAHLSASHRRQAMDRMAQRRARLANPEDAVAESH